MIIANICACLSLSLSFSETSSLFTLTLNRVMEIVGPGFASNYFVTSLKNFNNYCIENFMPTSLQLDPAVAAIL